MKSFGYLAVILICLVAVPLVAQEKAAKEAAAPADNMEIVREAIRAEKKVLIAENMGLTEAEATAFWPIYEQYQDARKALGDRDIKLIKEYAANYDAMTDEVAEKLIKEAIDIDQERVKLAHTFFPKFKKVLGGKKVARYYQLENKIQAVIDYDLAAQIPLVD